MLVSLPIFRVLLPEKFALFSSIEYSDPDEIFLIHTTNYLGLGPFRRWSYPTDYHVLFSWLWSRAWTLSSGWDTSSGTSSTHRKRTHIFKATDPDTTLKDLKMILISEKSKIWLSSNNTFFKGLGKKGFIRKYFYVHEKDIIWLEWGCSRTLYVSVPATLNVDDEASLGRILRIQPDISALQNSHSLDSVGSTFRTKYFSRLILLGA